MSDCANILIQSSLELDGKPHCVVLTEHCLVWENSSSLQHSGSPSAEPLFNDSCHSVPLKEVIAVHIERISRQEACRNQFGAEACCIELIPLWPCAFSVSCIKRAPRHRWKVRTLVFGCQDAATCEMWISNIRSLISNPAFNRPKNVIVFVNPYGGKKAAPKIYREKVAPLFALCSVNTDVIVTQRANHAQEIMENYNTSGLDGVVCVGGDGMFAELYNGLLTNTQRLNNRLETLGNQPISPSLRIGIIPAGSTDTVVYSTTGINDPVTSALHIIVGDSMGLDVSSIHHKKQLLCYNVSLLGYGFMGDVVENSEHHRWMGPKRYDWCGFKKIMSNKSYEGEISMLLSDDKFNHTRDGTRCMSGCKVCRTAREQDNATKSSSIIDMSDGWQRVKGQFMAINSHTMSCRCSKCEGGAAPCCHLGDGCADLVLIYSCSRFNYLRYLLRCANKTADQFDFPFVHTYRIKEFVFNTLNSNGTNTNSKGHSSKKGHKLPAQSAHSSVWNCDGEVIDHSDIHVRVNCQLIKIFARGIEEETVSERRPCSACCS